MQRIGIYGGTFNPPHLGHVRAAQYALDALTLDKLLVIPTCDAPHKELPENSPTPEQRLQMLNLCFQGEKRITVSDLELKRGGASYTYETIAQVKEMHPDAELILFMGTDMFLSFLNWRNPQLILRDASLAVFYRGDRDEKIAVEQQKQKIEDMGARVYLVDNPVTVISSTDMRRMLCLKCADAFLPSQVSGFISEKKLYVPDINWKALSDEALEQVVVSLIKPSRVNHVLGCRDTAVALAKLWGANEKDACRAALLHDITKALDGPLQLTLCNAYGIIPSDFAKENPKTIHALTGSLVAERIFGENPAVVSAIRSHTTGKANMNLLEKIIYVADYMEPNRSFDGVEKLRQLAETDIDSALQLGLEMTLQMLREQGKAISQESAEALAWIKNTLSLKG